MTERAVKKTIAAIFLIVTATMPAAAHKNPAQDCKVRFEFAYVDRLDNFYHGIQGQQLKEVQKRLGRYGDVCYTEDPNTSDYVFFVHTKPATYHGVQTSRNSVLDNNSTIVGSVESSVPYEMDYSVFILDVLLRHFTLETPPKETFTTLHTFDQRGLYNTIYGIGYGKGKKPIINVIDVAAKWLHENNLGK
jgi:hypothetical protein